MGESYRAWGGEATNHFALLASHQVLNNDARDNKDSLHRPTQAQLGPVTKLNLMVQCSCYLKNWTI